MRVDMERKPFYPSNSTSQDRDSSSTACVLSIEAPPVNKCHGNTASGKDIPVTCCQPWEGQRRFRKLWSSCAAAGLILLLALSIWAYDRWELPLWWPLGGEPQQRASEPASPLSPGPGGEAASFQLTAATYNRSKFQTLAFNGSKVGPLMRLILGQLVHVDVSNDNIDPGVTVHWHGMDQVNTSWADGTAGLTQTPIPVGTSFSYRFKAQPAGTFWYHSHMDGQFADGLRGPMVVRDPQDPLKELYDEDLDEHVMMLADVFGMSAKEQLQGLQLYGMAGMAGVGGMGAMGMSSDGGDETGVGMSGGGGGMGASSSSSNDESSSSGLQDMTSAAGAPEKVLGDSGGSGGSGGSGSGGAGGEEADCTAAGITARQQQQRQQRDEDEDEDGGGNQMSPLCPPELLDQDISDAPWGAVEVNGESFATTGSAAVFRVRQGRRYRFRTIGGMSSWALRLGVEGHGVTLIALDGRPISPAPAQAFVLTSGERVDWVLSADQPVGNYWISISTLHGLNSPAILSYEGAPDPRSDPRVAATAFVPNLTCASGVGGQPGLVDFKNATLQAGSGVPPPPRVSNKAFTLYLVNAAEAASQMPPAFPCHAAQPHNVYGLPPSFGSALLRSGSSSSALTCPPVSTSRTTGTAPPSKYCWSLNWNVFQPPPSLPLSPAGDSASSSGSSGSSTATAALSSAQAHTIYNVELEQGDVVDLALINPSRMVHPMHLHGGGFWVLASGNGNILDAATDSVTVNNHSSSSNGSSGSAGLGLGVGGVGVSYNLHNPVFRDVFPVPQSVRVEGGSSSSGRSGSSGNRRKGEVAGADPDAQGGDSTADTKVTTQHGDSSIKDGGGEGEGGDGEGEGGFVDPADGYGYAVIRFRADNPGVWAFHCHIDLHAASGMFMYFTVRPRS